MSDEATDTFTMTLAGREILFRRAHVGQVIMLQRIAMRGVNLARGEGVDEQQRIRAVQDGIVKVLDFIDTLIVNDDDRQFLEDKMLTGEITWEQVSGALGGGEAEQADDEPPKTRRAPKKSPKAAPAVAVAAKSVTPRGRAKR